MKKAAFGFFVMAFMFLASCKKDDNTTTKTGPATYGTFSFKGSSYTASSCTAAGIYLTAYDGNTLTGPNLQVNFPGSTLPTTGGTYIVAQGSPGGANQISIDFSPSLTSIYASTGGNGAQTVTVTVNAGKLNVVGNNIELVGITPGDSSAINFNITQQ